MIEDIKDVLVGIPSLSRPEYITKKTMKWLHESKLPFKIFVEPHEKFLYKQYNGDCVVSLPKSGMGIMYAFNCMQAYARKHGYKYLFRLDDDVDGFVRTDTDETDYINAFYKTVIDLRSAFDTFPKLGGVRFTQYRFWVFSKKDMHKWTHINKPMQGICMVRLDAIPKISNDLKMFDDTIVSMYMWKNGYFTLNYGLSGLKVVQNANKGGFQTQDRRALAIQAIELLKKDFPLVSEKDSTAYFGVDVDIDPYLAKYGYLSVNCNDIGLKKTLEKNNIYSRFR